MNHECKPEFGAARQALDQFVIRRVTELSAAGRCRKATLRELDLTCQFVWDAHFTDLSQVIDAVDFMMKPIRRSPEASHKRERVGLRVCRAK